MKSTTRAFQRYEEHNKRHHCLGDCNAKRKTNKEPSSIDGYECDAIGNTLGTLWEHYKTMKIGACPHKE